MMATTANRAGMVRAAAWAGMAVILVARIAIDLAGMDVRTQVLLSDVLTYLLPMALVVVFGVSLGRSTVGSGVEHRLWGTVTAGTLLTLIGESYWTYYAVFIEHLGPPIDSPVRILFLVAAMLMLSLGVTLTHFTDEPLLGRLTFYIETLAIATILYVVVFQNWTWPAYSAVEPRLEASAIAAVYPVFGGFIVFAVILAAVWWRARTWPAWAAFAAASLFVYGLGLFVFPVWYPQFLATETLQPTWFTWALGAGYYLLFIGMVYRATDPADQSDAGLLPPLRPGDAMWSRAYPVIMGCAMLWLGHEAVGVSGEPRGVPVMVGAITLAVLLGARSWLLEAERSYHRKSVVTDPATGAFSRRHLDVRLEQVISDAGDRPIALAVFDIDGFSRFEEEHEALAVLAEVAAALEAAGGERHEVFRLDADAFAMTAPGCGVDRGVAIAERAIATVRDRGLARLGTLVGLTAGVAVYPLHATSAADLLTAARDTCRAAKGRLGGQVRVAGGSGQADEAPQQGMDSRHRASRDTLIVLADAVDGRDGVSGGHSVHVAELIGPLCRALGLPEDRVQVAVLAALVHDVGKIGVPDSVLGMADDQLSTDERQLLEEHAELGERILDAAGLVDPLPIVRHHHERWDGQGYPDRLEGHQIPLEARALAVCNTFAMLVAERPTRAAYSAEAALAQIEAEAGLGLDPSITAIFTRMMRRDLRFAPGEAGDGARTAG